MFIAIIEDNIEAGKYLENLLIGNNHTSVWYTNGKDAMANLGTRALPEVILMDINLPDISGIELTKIIKNKYPKIEIIVQTVNDNSEILIQAIKAGASGYILKGASSTEILSAIHLVMEGGTFITGKLARRMLTEFDTTPAPIDNEETSSLTPKEKELLQDIVQRKSYKEIADLHNVSINTVNAHIKNIYKKLQVRSRGEIVKKFG